jgi:hypothetical protein
MLSFAAGANIVALSPRDARLKEKSAPLGLKPGIGSAQRLEFNQKGKKRPFWLNSMLK